MIAVLWSNPPFARLWLGALISALGDGLTWVALSWLALEQGGAASVGLMLLCFGLPAALTGAGLGRLVDRYGTRLVMVADNLLRGLIVAAVPALALAGRLELWQVYALAALAGALAPASQVGVRVLTSVIVGDARLEAANALLSLTVQISTVLSPALAGALVAAWGSANVLWLDAVSFGGFAVILLGLPNSVSKEGSAPGSSSLRILLQYPAVVAVTGLSLAFFAAYGPLEAALPAFAKEVLNVGADRFGLIWSGLGVGTILGTLLIALLSRFPTGQVLSLIALGWGLSQFALAFAPGFGVALLWMVIGGMVWGPYTALETTLIQRTMPLRERGQVFGVRSGLLAPAAPLGAALGGALLGFLSPVQVIALSALACALAGGLALFIPALHGGRAQPNLDRQIPEEHSG
jgi:MFS family permease